MWQDSSQEKCWYCRHTFSHVPAYLPTRDRRGIFHLTGNFCSWNCVKAYTLPLRRERGHEWIGLFAFLTSHRANKCRTPPWLRHPLDCQCMEGYQPMRVAAPLSTLKLFGGHSTIDQFRDGFSIIYRHDVIKRLFLPIERGGGVPTVGDITRRQYLYDRVTKTIETKHEHAVHIPQPTEIDPESENELQEPIVFLIE